MNTLDEAIKYTDAIFNAALDVQKETKRHREPEEDEVNVMVAKRFKTDEAEKTDANKAKKPEYCIQFQKNRCKRTNCPYLHERKPKI